ncbi:extracellular solute-binding protein [Anaerocolumna sp. MB42-C2]|uniref:extracellular solute-binding protein n=1 Tax=Anaerocolumna sp. MB42-C2 TaxID=3070997 RepID=UPI0027E0059F|nr:extracellular solute-binding protein [Anaerocolumna sp. MB42-C2]WMJ86209.1 extracellular solute-binding protein [Anaerocolumna sp. MB42-C2]
MKIKLKKQICCLLVFVFAVTMFSGCGGKNSKVTGSSDINSAAEVTNEAEPAATAETNTLAANIAGNTAPTDEEKAMVNDTLEDSYLGDVFDTKIPNNYSAYPMDATLDVWMPSNSILASVCDDINKQRVFEQVEKLTGIKLNFIIPPLGEETTNFNLMIASGELPDIILDAGRYTGGIAAGVADGAYLPLNDIIEKNMPNYNEWRNSDDERRVTSVLDDGTIGAVYGLAPYNEWCWFGTLIKQEALDKTGLEVPETIDEWHDFLVACKNAGYKEPLNYGSTYGQIFTGILNGAYGVWDWMYVDKDGKAAWGPAAPGAKDYLTMMQQWNKEGLFNKDWATADFNQRMAEAASSDCAVMMDSPDTMWGYWKQDNNIDFVAALNPVLKKGDKPQQTYHNFKSVGSIAAITTQCDNVDAACAFLDFAYTKKGWEVYNYGTYGDVHLVDDKGLPYFPENSLMYNDPDGQPASNLIWKYRIHDFADIRDEHNSNPLITAKGSYSGKIREFWTENTDDSMTMPPVSFTSEESSRQGELGTVLSTMRNEYFAKIIMGQLPVSAYDEFLEKAKAQGMDEFVQLWQSALERYNAR